MTNTTTFSTDITVRVIAKGGKFLGADISGATVTIRHAVTGELLASGQTQGGSGDLWEIMVNPRPRTSAIPTTGASAFVAIINTHGNAPVPLLITATGPGAGLQSTATTSTTQWIVPGLPVINPSVTYSCLLELPGLIVQVMEPATHLNVTKPLPQTINFTVNVAMMCGCPIDNKQDTDGTHTFPNPWPVNDFVVGCFIGGVSQPSVHVPLSFDASANMPGRYVGHWQMKEVDFYTGYVYAYQISTGNTGTAAVSFFHL